MVRDAYRSHGRAAASGRSACDGSSFIWTGLLVVQATWSIVLVVAPTMLARSLDKFEQQEFGFQVPGRVVVPLSRPPACYTFPKVTALCREWAGSDIVDTSREMDALART
jgi:hypothetical protein